jgi:hypothetical protein
VTTVFRHDPNAFVMIADRDDRNSRAERRDENATVTSDNHVLAQERVVAKAG